MALDAAAAQALLRAVETGLRGLEHLEFEFAEGDTDGLLDVGDGDGYDSGSGSGSIGGPLPPQLPQPHPAPHVMGGAPTLLPYGDRDNNKEEVSPPPAGPVSPSVRYRRRALRQLHRLSTSTSSNSSRGHGSSPQPSRAFFDEEFRRIILNEKRAVPLSVSINDP